MATVYQIGFFYPGAGVPWLDIARPEFVDHAAQAGGADSPDASRYSWTTTSGDLIHGFSFNDDITFTATAPLGGTVHALRVDESYVVGGMSGNLVAMTTSLEGYWRAILDGETSIFASGIAEMRISGDFGTVGSTEVLTGADDVFEGAVGRVPVGIGAQAESQMFFGDARLMAGVLTGGDDTITMREHGLVSGDIQSGNGTLYGGNDRIVLDGTIGDDEDVSSSTSFVAGDALTFSSLFGGTPMLFGGNDTVVVRNYAGNAISGEARSAAGWTDGGDDLIDASVNLREVILYGDVQNLSGELRGGNDRLIGSNVTEGSTLSGDAGELSSGAVLWAGADSLTGGKADDTLYGDFQSLLSGSASIDSACTGDDRIYGGGGNDTLFGQVGDDTLDGGLGNDTLDGGSQTAGAGDVAAFDVANVSVSADLLLGFALGQGVDTLTGIENVRGSSKVDSLAGDNLANRLEGLDGNDQLLGRGGDDTLLGGNGNDTLQGGDDADTLFGGTGTNSLSGGAGNDLFFLDSASDVMIETAGGGVDRAWVGAGASGITLGANVEHGYAWGAGDRTFFGGSTDNSLFGATGNDRLEGGDGLDRLIGGGGADSLHGGAGNDTLSGDGGDDTLQGGDDADTLFGGTGTNSLSGGAGNDLFFLDSASDVMIETAGGGLDRAYVGAGASGITLGANIEQGFVWGAGARTIFGGSTDNTLFGATGNDHLEGGDGLDRLIGGGGADSLHGGAGNDTLQGGVTTTL